MIVTTRLLALVGSGRSSDAFAEAQQRIVLHGAVRHESLSGGAIPLQAARVVLDAGDVTVGPQQTDERGRFTFCDTNRGNYTLRVYLEDRLEPVLEQRVSVPMRAGTATVVA